MPVTAVVKKGSETVGCASTGGIRIQSGVPASGSAQVSFLYPT